MTRAEAHVVALAAIVAGFIVLLWLSPPAGGSIMAAGFLVGGITRLDDGEDA